MAIVDSTPRRPDLRRYCRCTHWTGHHQTGAGRPCSVVGCSCEALVKQAVPLCTTCGHWAPFHHPQRRTGDTSCTALGCACPCWRSGQAPLRIEVAIPLHLLETYGSDGLVLTITVQG